MLDLQNKLKNLLAIDDIALIKQEIKNIIIGFPQHLSLDSYQKEKLAYKKMLDFCYENLMPYETQFDLVILFEMFTELFGVSYSVNSRETEYVFLRHSIVYYIHQIYLRENKKLNTEAIRYIALQFGNKDRTTIYNSLEKAENYIYTQDEKFTKYYMEFLKKIENYEARNIR